MRGNEMEEHNLNAVDVAFVHKSLEERIVESGVPLSFGEEIDWGQPQGDEIW